MKLEREELDAIGEIVATRYFFNQGWDFTNLRDAEKIYSTLEDLEEQYNRYPYMSRDWYVANSANKRIHMCERWDELEGLVKFLKMFKSHFDFILKTDGNLSLCVITTKDEEFGTELKEAIAAARKSNYSVYVFSVEIPNEIEFELLQVTGAYKKS
ncbi:MAG: hypothetical protein SVM80_08475 [Halobacteriota archaeon]|nr:hypothetical protein [Halobacteriota archaeon]